MKKIIIINCICLCLCLKNHAQVTASKSISNAIEYLQNKRPSFVGAVASSDPKISSYAIAESDIQDSTKGTIYISQDGVVTVDIEKKYNSLAIAKKDMKDMIETTKKMYPSIAEQKSKTPNTNPNSVVTRAFIDTIKGDFFIASGISSFSNGKKFLVLTKIVATNPGLIQGQTKNVKSTDDGIRPLTGPTTIRKSATVSSAGDGVTMALKYLQDALPEYPNSPFINGISAEDDSQTTYDVKSTGLQPGGSGKVFVLASGLTDVVLVKEYSTSEDAEKDMEEMIASTRVMYPSLLLHTNSPKSIPHLVTEKTFVDQSRGTLICLWILTAQPDADDSKKFQLITKFEK